MKKLLIALAILAIGTCIISCDKQPIEHLKDKLTVKILQESAEETDTPKELTLLCIDGVTYLRTAQGGLTVKFQANKEGDPSAEECE